MGIFPYKYWNPALQAFVMGNEADQGEGIIVLAFAGVTDDNDRALYETDIVSTDNGPGTIRHEDGEWTIELLGHGRQPLAEQTNIHYLGNQYTHLPDGSSIAIIED